MVPVAMRATTAALTAGTAVALMLTFCMPAGAEPATTTSPVTTATTAPTTTTTAPTPVTVPRSRSIVLIGTAASAKSSIVAQSSGPTQLVGGQAVNPPPRTLPHTGTASLALTLLGAALVALGALALRGEHPQLRLLRHS